MRNVIRMTTAAVMVVALAGVTGCATPGDLEDLRNELKPQIDQASADAAAAKADAAAAKAAADRANSTASETSEKLDRMFKQSMQK